MSHLEQKFIFIVEMCIGVVTKIANEWQSYKGKLRDEAIGDNSKVPYKPFGRTSRQSNGNTEKDSCTKILQKNA